MSKPPWPNDAVMIVAALAGKENRAHMESVLSGECRDCGAKLAYDGWTLRRATELEQRIADSRKCEPRPVKFYCIDCACKHDKSHLDICEDHRFPKPCN